MEEEGGKQRWLTARLKRRKQNVSAHSHMTHKSQLFSLCCPIKKGSAHSRLGAGDYEVLKGQFSSSARTDLCRVNNWLRKILIHDSCTVFVCVDECLVASDPDMSKGLRMTVRGQICSQLSTLITLISEGKHQLCWVHFLFPASDLGKNLNDGFQQLSWSLQRVLSVTQAWFETKRAHWCLCNVA